VRALEARLEVRLLNRTTRSVSPTEAGARLAARLLPLLDDLEAAAAAAEPDGAPSGRLRINASRMAGLHVVAPLVAPFLARHPKVSLDLVLDDALVDIVSDGFDAGVRLGERLEGDMIAVRLGGELRMAVVGSPAYLAARGAPEHPRDLAGHACLGARWPTDGSPYRWELERGGEEVRVPVAGPLVCDEPAVRLRAAADGLGLAYVFEAEAASWLASGRLVRVLEPWTPPFPGCFLYYPGRRHLSPALRAFIDFAKAALAPDARSGAADPPDPLPFRR
jgi:DNA-binding transcriptional LysR family regulator